MNSQPGDTKDRRETRGLALGVLGVLIFSLSLPATKAAVPVFGAWTVGIGRAVIAAALAGLVLAATRTRLPQPSLRRSLLVVAGGVVLGFPLFTALALQYVPASRGAIVVGVLPAATAAVAAIRHGERPSLRFWLAAVAGLATVVVFAVLTGSGGRPEPADGLLLLAVASAAVGYAEGGVVSSQIGGWQTISWALVFALPVTLPVTIAALAVTDIAEITTKAVLGFGYVAVFSMFLGFFAWYAGMGRAGVARVSQIQLAQPVLTLVWASVLLDESVTFGAILAATGVLLSIVATRRAPIRPSSASLPIDSPVHSQAQNAT
ncbi:MAG: DMT family transporter [Acidimicrobiales bacterium]